MIKNFKGFSILELIVVLGIIGVFAAISLPNFNTARWRASDARSVAELGSLNKILQIYKQENHGLYPPHRVYTAACIPGELEGLCALLTKGYYKAAPLGLMDGEYRYNGVGCGVYYGRSGCKAYQLWTNLILPNYVLQSDDDASTSVLEVFGYSSSSGPDILQDGTIETCSREGLDCILDFLGK